MSELHPILLALPVVLQWSAVVGIALLVPLAPMFIVRALNVEDARKERIERQTISGAADRAAVDSVALLTVDEWPSMEEVVYEDASTGPTPVGFEFKAETIAEDIGSALTSRGIEVQTTEITEIDEIEDLGDADLAVVVFPARHKQLPWQLLAFFDEIVEPRAAAKEPPLGDIPFAALALGDTSEDVAPTRRHIERMEKRYGMNVLANKGFVETRDRLALYEKTLGYAETMLRPAKSPTSESEDGT